MKTSGKVISVSLNGKHNFSKEPVEKVKVVKGIGVEGDAHSGDKVQHLSRVRVNPDQPNLRQVHLIHKELLDELSTKGFSLKAGDLGENILTEGLELLSLPQKTLLKIGETVRLEVTGLRNPCKQIENFREGLLKEVLDKNEKGIIVRKTGIMSIVLESGVVKPGDVIEVVLPPEPHHPLERV